MPSGTNVTNLIPGIEVSDDVTEIDPPSGVPRNFSNPVEYTLTGKFGNEQIWIASVILLSNENEIISFQIPEQAGETIIDDYLHTVLVEVPEGTIVTALTPEISISENATINPESGVPQDFTEPLVYTVTAQNGDEQEWEVTVDILTGIFSDNSHGYYIYPNPSKGLFNLTGFFQAVRLQITDITGKTIYTSALSDLHSERQIDLSNQPKGIYFIKIETENGTLTEKLIIH